MLALLLCSFLLVGQKGALYIKERSVEALWLFMLLHCCGTRGWLTLSELRVYSRPVWTSWRRPCYVWPQQPQALLMMSSNGGHSSPAAQRVAHVASEKTVDIALYAWTSVCFSTSFWLMLITTFGLQSVIRYLRRQYLEVQGRNITVHFPVTESRKIPVISIRTSETKRSGLR